jgi:hypothetical protein
MLEIATFFEAIGYGEHQAVHAREYRRDILRTLELHGKSFAAHGWRIVQVGRIARSRAGGRPEPCTPE